MPFCSYCRNELSAEARACPKCGHPAAGSSELADFWTRFAAYLIDALVLAVPALVVGFVLPLGGIGLVFLYDWLMVAENKGQTLGKMVMRIRVAGPDGTLVDHGPAAARAGMGIVSGLALGLGYLWAAWDPERRTWHDMVAETRVFVVNS